ncbi:hypothetical protein GCM10022251_78740 [Phytohabitans flavus]|uniref:Peptidase S8/S53 domain-containing protein n=1 Tax=Phytohabitans flavus TaxID=1076124 RepID=A0A6F8XLP2_9ACTN|nr:S8 family serine peptidase [Phytohabitans flavus]BCB74744.1 hypothetical protein Pflav_011540 [Phytohabitans flavus]
MLDRSVAQIGAPEVWRAGYDGSGIDIAVLDTGVDASHPDLAGKVDAAVNFSDSPAAEDHVGHGTHVAAIAAGTGAASGGLRKGVAPGARVLSGKVLSDDGLHTEPVPVTEDLVYTNAGPNPTTVDIAAPRGIVPSLTPVTVPAGGTATVPVTRRPPGRDGRHHRR